MRRLVAVLVLAAMVVGCVGAAPTPVIVYVTPAPTPIIVYVTPPPSEAPTPSPTKMATPAPTPAPTPTPTPRPTADLVAGKLFNSPKACWERDFSYDSEGNYSDGGPVKLSVTVRNRGKAQSDRLWMLIELRAPTLLPVRMEQNWNNFSHYISVRDDDGGPYGAIWLPMIRLGPGKSFTYRTTISFEELGKAEYRVTIATGPAYDLSITLSDFTEVRTYDGLSTVMQVCS